MGIKGRAIVWFLGAILGLPFTIYGVEWMMLKVSKQQLNCIEDTNRSLFDLEPKVGSSMVNEIGKISESFDYCRKNVDARKDNIEFIKEELRRSRAYD